MDSLSEPKGIAVNIVFTNSSCEVERISKAIVSGMIFCFKSKQAGLLEEDGQDYLPTKLGGHCKPTNVRGHQA